MRVLLFMSILLLASCAQMFPPSGGEKDETPPQVVEEKTTPRNRSMNFNSKTIVLVFDEYVKLNNPGEQIIISPAMEKKPDFVLKGKKLYIELNSELKPNTTYTINFGNSITDITENNPVAGMTYVFSTGSFIDSLSLNGTVTNAFTNAPEKNVWVLLHKNLSDTSFQKNFPDYLTKTDASGNYSLLNLSAGEYNIYALRDGNSDYKYSQPSEEIAFHNETVIIGEKNEEVNLRMFKEEEKKIYVKSSSFFWPGKFNIVLNRKVRDANCIILPIETNGENPKIIDNNFILETDTLKFTSIINRDNPEVSIKIDIGDFHDTLQIRIPEYKEKPLVIKSNINDHFGVLDDVTFGSDYNIDIKNNSLLEVYENDSILIQPLILQYKYLNLEYKWKDRTTYKIIMKEKCFQDDFNRFSKADTILFTPKSKDYYGELIVNFDFPEAHYIFEIQNSNEKTLRFIASRYSKMTHWNVDKFKPGTYKLKLTLDTNLNGKWDTGNLSEKKQPEKIYYYKDPIVIRSNWDFELTWKIEN